MTAETTQAPAVMAGGRRAVFLHVGSPKTGTTYLQSLLARHRAGLREVGVLYPGSREREQFNAALDLREIKFAGYDDPAVPGAWERLVDEVLAWPGTAVISHEILAAATPEQVQRAVRSFGPADVHVVLTTRDLARQVPSTWQEHLKNRHATRWSDYVAAIRETEAGAEVAGEAGRLARRFWRAQDAADILQRWACAVPADRLHLITVPKPASHPDLLWRRFAGLVGIDPDTFDGVAKRRNPSLGVVEAELLRRLNERIDEELPWPRYRQLVKRSLAEGILVANTSSSHLVLDGEQSAWAAKRSQELIEHVEASGYHVVGDLAELLPDQHPVDGSRTNTPDDVSIDELLNAAGPAIVGYVIDLAAGQSAPPPGVRAEQPEQVRAVRRLVAAARRRAGDRLERVRAAAVGRRALSAARALTEHPAVYVHVGLPKTGTTYLQALLVANREKLLRAGVLYPSRSFNAHFFAALDLLGTGFRGHRYKGVDGAWDRLAGEVRAWPGVSIVSHEMLFRATDEHVRRLVESLAPVQVEVIITARDLARQLPALWQEQLKLGRDYTWAEFLAAVGQADPSPAAALAPTATQPDGGDQAPGLATKSVTGRSDDERGRVLRRYARRFWLGRDVAAVADRWAEVIPAEHIHVVTVPAPGASQGVLWERFASVIGLPAGDYEPPQRGANTSLGPAEAELLRRLNPALNEQLTWENYERHVKWKLAERVLARRPARPRMVLPAQHWPWVEAHSHRIVKQLSAGGYDLSGRLDDLIPTRPADADKVRHPDQTDDAEVLDAALDALAGLVHLRSGHSAHRSVDD